MRLLSNLWRSIADFIDFLESRIKIHNQKRFGRFILGSIIGIFPIAIYWGYAAFFGVDIQLNRGIIGSLIFMLAFGIAGIYGKLDKFIDGMSNIQL